MVRSSHILLTLLALAPACAQTEDLGPVAATAPALDKADGSDSADHACEIVLRDAGRVTKADGSFKTVCTSGECLYVWTGAIDVAETAWLDGATVRLLYHRTTDETWWDVAAEARTAVVPSYRRFGFKISDHLFGPAEADAGVEVELVAYLALPGNVRVFDHNRVAGDLENLRLTSGEGYAAYDPGICQPVTAHINFDVNGGSAYNDLRQDGWIAVNFALDRLPACRAKKSGKPAWDTVAYARFFPSGEIVQQSVRAFKNPDGTAASAGVAVPFNVEIPDDATAAELWFHNFNTDGSCDTWDSNYGANYRYVVRGAPGNAARCDGYSLAVANYTYPICLGYDVAAQTDAGCEVHLDGIGHAYEGHYGIPHEWVETYVHSGATDGPVENIGMWVRFRDKDGAVHEQFQLGSAVSPGAYKTMFDLSSAYAGTLNTVEQLAFFVDVRRASGQVERLWQSRHGANYSWADAFSLPTMSTMIPYGHMEWANDASSIYDSRNACL